jgi:hypothetical protein
MQGKLNVKAVFGKKRKRNASTVMVIEVIANSIY